MAKMEEIVSISAIGRGVPRWKLWQPLLEEWAKGLVRFANLVDLPGWYPERSQTGFLAAAVWRLGGKACAVEEYIWSGRESKEDSPIDLWFQVDGYSICVEAKKRTLNEASDNDKVRKALDLAQSQLEGRDHTQANLGMAICFAALNVQPSGSPEQDCEHVRQLGQVLAEEWKPPKHVVGISWIPAKIRQERRHVGRRQRFPLGLALVGRVVWQNT